MSVNGMADRDVTFEIVENIGIIASYATGWNKELNLVSWNGGAVKYDIRDWDPAHEHMSRGVTLHDRASQEAAHAGQGFGRLRRYTGSAVKCGTVQCSNKSRKI